MTLRHTTLAFIAIAIAYSCNNSTTNDVVKDTVVAPTPTAPVTATNTSIDVDTSYKLNPATNTDSVVANTDAFLVTTKPNEGDPGEIIGVYNKATKKSFGINSEDEFLGVNGNYLLTEGGTAANHRSFSVYDLTTLKIVFSDEYEKDLDLKNGIVSFKKAVTITDPALKPKCSPQQKIPANNLGYIEQQYFDLTTKTLQKTGKYECWFFE